MAITIAQTKEVHRYDNTKLPEFTATNADGAVFISSGLYILGNDSPYEFEPPNITQDITLEYRNLIYGDGATLGSGVSLTGGNDFSKSGASWSGAYFPSVASGNFSVETGTDNTSRTIAISIQSGSVEYNFLDTACDYAMTFGASGIWTIRKNGAELKRGSYTATDKMLMVVKDGLLQFFLINAAREWTLLYTTRPTWSYPLTPVVTLYTDSAFADAPACWVDTDSSTTASASLEVQAVLDYFQGWGNNAGLRDTFERIALEGGGFETSRTESKTKRRFYELSRGSTEESFTSVSSYTVMGRAEFEQFVRDNALGDFWFIDRARGGNSVTEIWAHFEGDMTDPKTGYNYAEISQAIAESVDIPRLAT